MKVLDIKSAIIGALSTALVFACMGGQSSEGNDTRQDQHLGDVTVNSLEIVDEDGKKMGYFGYGKQGGLFKIYDGEQLSVMARARKGGNGQVDVLNDHKQVVGTLTANKSDGGIFDLANDDNQIVATLAVNRKGGGSFSARNADGQKVALVQSGQKGEGVMALYNKYGEPIWVPKKK